MDHKFKPGDRITNPTLTPSKVVAVFDPVGSLGYDMVRVADGSGNPNFGRSHAWSKVEPIFEVDKTYRASTFGKSPITPTVAITIVYTNDTWAVGVKPDGAPWCVYQREREDWKEV